MNRVLLDGTSILWTRTGPEFLINKLVLDKDILSFSFQVSQNCGSNECYIEYMFNFKGGWQVSVVEKYVYTNGTFCYGVSFK